MSRTHPQIRFRPPPDLKERIEQEAAANRRSMNAQMVLCIEKYFEAQNTTSSSTLESNAARRATNHRQTGEKAHG